MSSTLLPSTPSRFAVRTIGEFSVGQSHSLKFIVDAPVIEKFAQFSGDFNPVHVDPVVAVQMGHAKPVAHGVIAVAFLSRLIGMHLPGAGALWMSQSIDWLAPVYLGDEVELTATVVQVSVAAGVLTLKVHATNQQGRTVMTGEGKVSLSELGARTTSQAPQSDRVALVIGGSRGIGAAVVRRLADMPAQVAIVARTESAASISLGLELTEKGRSFRFYAADIADPEDAERMIRHVLSAYGHVDVVVHCATPTLPNVEAAALRYADMERFLRSYLVAATVTTTALVAKMRERRFGRFIFLGTSAMFGTPPAGMAAYLAAKGALWGLTRSMAAELGPFGITTNMVSPGMTVTDLTTHVSARVKEVEARRSPTRRLADVSDSAALIAFLAGDEAGYINGVNLPLTGGPI